MTGLPPVDGPLVQLKPILASFVIAPLFMSAVGGEGTKTHVAPLPTADKPLSP